MRYFIVAVVVFCIGVAGCSSSDGGASTSSSAVPRSSVGGGSDSISFTQSFNGPAYESLFAGSGEAVDRGLLCPEATGVFVGNEDADGNALTDAENDAFYTGSERFLAVTVEEMACDDASGAFVFRVFTEIDPLDPDYAPGSTSWTITGAAGYESTVGEGESSLPEFIGDGVAVWTGSGTITSPSGN